jgi:hypothetical protein
MKIAICLSGLSKCFRFTHNFLFNLLNKTDNVSIFAHTWDIDDKFKELPFDTKNQFSFFKDNYTVFEIEKYDTTMPWNILTPEQHETMPPSCKNTVPMFYSIYRANELKKQYENINGKFDIVIRSRFDSLYEYPLINNELFLINKFKNLIFCGWAGYDRQEKLSRNWFQYDDAAAPFVSDNFAFGSSEAMDVYSNTYNVLLNFKNFYSGGDNVSGFIPGPEICLGTNLLLEKINFLRTTFKYKTLTGFDDKNLFFSNYYGHTDNSILKI